MADTPLFFDSEEEQEEVAAENILESEEGEDSDLEIIATTSNKRKLERADSASVVEIDAVDTRYKRFIGEIMISGWSTVNGKAYISSGEQVMIERDKSVKTKVAKSVGFQSYVDCYLQKA